MYGIFRIKDDDSIIIDKDALLLIPELSKISEKELKYIILVYDWFDSPLRKMPMILKKQMAKRRIWGNITREVENSVNMIKAVVAYRSICYDPVRDSLEAIRSKVNSINKKITDPDLNLKDGKEYVGQLEFFEQKLYELENEVKREDVILEIKGQKKLSNLEKWQKRQIQFRKIKEMEE